MNNVNFARKVNSSEWSALLTQIKMVNRSAFLVFRHRPIQWKQQDTLNSSFPNGIKKLENMARKYDFENLWKE